MKKVLTPTRIFLTTRADGTATLHLTGLSDTIEVEFTAEQWARLGEDARWFAEQRTAEVAN